PVMALTTRANAARARVATCRSRRSTGVMIFDSTGSMVVMGYRRCVGVGYMGVTGEPRGEPPDAMRPQRRTRVFAAAAGAVANPCARGERPIRVLCAQPDHRRPDA